MSDIKWNEEDLKNEAEQVLNSFKDKMNKIAEETMADITCKYIPHIENDAWTNYRESLRSDLEHLYVTDRFRADWATNLRRRIFQENREEMTALLNKDLLDRIKVLEDLRKEYPQLRYSEGS